MADVLPRLAALVWLAVLVLAGAASAQEEKPLTGVALVIGQSGYEHLPALANPVNDARQLEETLRLLGFEPTVATDLNARRLRRAVDNFAEDAEGADVAVVYYAGHGIEAAGENWLIPVDADANILDGGGKGMVALSSVIEALRERVPLVLVFLDACRSNPFPPGAQFTTATGEVVAVSASGLAVTRGVSEAETGPSEGDIGTLIGFAAEPGRAALDGPEGGHSPYASALLRHLSAMDGAEFGTVMRMVAEEVYLKTQGRQRPWVNETLTRLIYLGVAPPAPAADDGRILAERRQLLLTITSLSDPARAQVEVAAQQAGVPMDALYGLLRSLGTEVPADAVELDRLLAAEAVRVKDLLASRQALDSQDAEIVRLAGLADQALQDGALDAYLDFWQQAKARYLEISSSLDATEAQLKARRIEGGEVLASTAAAFELKADYPSAAENYALAFAQVEKWDEGNAWDYKQREANAWLAQGDERADDAALARALDTFGVALALMPRETDPVKWATTQNNIGNALLVRGRREPGTATIEQAIATYGLALEVRTRASYPRDWAKTQNNLAIAYLDLAERKGDPAYVERAVEAYRAALTETSRASDPMTWATLMNNLGDALSRQGGDRLDDAIATHRAAMEERRRDRVPMLWAASQENLGSALVALGKHRGDATAIAEGIAAYGAALEVVTRERAPLHWSGLHYNLGNAHGDLAGFDKAADNLQAAVSHYRDALLEETFERSPEQWAKTQYMLGERLWTLGELTSDNALRRQGIEAQRASLRLYTRARNEADWAITVYILAMKLHRLGVIGQTLADVSEAADLLRQSLDFYTRERNAKDWADTMASYGDTLATLGFIGGDIGRIEDALVAFVTALEVHTREGLPLSWASTTLMRANALYYLAVLRNEAAPAREARDLVSEAALVLEQEGRQSAAKTARDLIATFDAFIARTQP